MFDKNVQNTYTKNFVALFMSATILFAYTPLVIADPLILPMVSNTVEKTESIAAEDEDPASANRHFMPKTVTETLILAHANDLGLNAFELKEQLYSLAEMTEHIESDNNRYATNKYSGAMSYYQFLPNSVVTAVNRLENMMREHNMGPLPAWARNVRNNPETMYDLSKPQQRLIMLANIIARNGSDAKVIALAEGNDEMAKTIYYKYHHTSPDRATKSRTERLHPIYFTDTVALN